MNAIISIDRGKISAPEIKINDRWPLVGVIGGLLYFFNGQRLVIARIESVDILCDPNYQAYNAGRALTVRHVKV
jgi:hypothetical protein